MAPKKLLLAYSGGLDTSCILAWLLEQGWEVLAFMANIGQEEDFEAAKAKALKIGASKDLRKEFIDELVFPAVQCNAVYEGVYLLGTSLARPVIARSQIAIAKREGCIAVSHGCTGKGNDQVRFELGYYALNPDIEPDYLYFYNRFAGRKDLLEYASQKGIPVAQTAAKPWSTDENIAHCSYEAGILEDPNTSPPKDMFKLTVNPEDAPEKPESFTLFFEKGIPVALQTEKTYTDSLELFLALNSIARKHGVGRIDIVESRFIGIKSRGVYETPALTCLRAAHMDLEVCAITALGLTKLMEGLTLDRNVRALRDQFVTFNFGQILYNGMYFSPEREFLSDAIVSSQKSVNGQVRCQVYKGNFSVLGRSSKTERLYNANESSMDELGGFEPCDTTGFIKIESIRIKNWANNQRNQNK
ncbi:Argininosuccinate synthase [Neolecta irregularis DAH-3]|uniref:Argininosuccinate synthase n=1 Tax=Neolecta irregularis (strain DAH-3) TaxID=1198029 RepID=A0A1U7LSQ2_NEOID|nr:Argininosuccinate synthase [Neolecta irregularis DAH-3]|eukprot:OLL25572.1 Argininosuccinate synthase [Neolecta irregularis DAH-3]